MYKIINDGNVGVVFFTPDESNKVAASRQVDEETIKDEAKLKETIEKKDYHFVI